MGLNGPGLAPKEPLACIGRQRTRFRLALNGGFIDHLPSSIVSLSFLVPRALAAVCLPGPFRSRLCGYTPGEGTVTGTGGGPPTRSRGGDGLFLAASGLQEPVLGLPCGSVPLPLGSFGESSSWGLGRPPPPILSSQFEMGGRNRSRYARRQLDRPWRPPLPPHAHGTDGCLSLQPHVPIWFLGSIIP